MESAIVVIIGIIIFITILSIVLYYRRKRSTPQEPPSKVPPKKPAKKFQPRRVSTEKAILKLLNQAYINRQRLTIEYETGNPLPGEPAIKIRDIDIYGLGDEYFEAYCHFRDALRTFKISRVLWAGTTNVTYKIPYTYEPNTWVTDGWGIVEDLEDRRLESTPGMIKKHNYSPAPREKERQHRISREQALSPRSDEKSRSYTRYDWQKRWEESIATPFPEEWTPALPYLFEAHRLEREGAEQQKVQEVLEKAREADSQATAFYTVRWSIIKKVQNQRRKSRPKE